MTEEQVIQRIKTALRNCIDSDHHAERAAYVAWSEMKAIVRENSTGPVPAWRNDMTIEQAAQELLSGLKSNPTIPNDSGTGWL